MLPLEAIFAALHERGHSPLPISRRLHLHDPKPYGKAPGEYIGLDQETGEPRWVLLKGWNSYCTDRATIHRARAWGRMADTNGGGLGVACGYGDLIGIDIDDEALIEPLKAVLPPMIVAKRGRKGLTAFYRGEHPRDDTEWWQKKNYAGLIDFLAHDSQTVLPPSIHPDTGKPYEWMPGRTLLDTSVSELPAFTNHHFMAMEDVLRGHGWAEPKSARQPHTSDSAPRKQTPKAIHSAFLSAVRAARAQWLPELRLHRFTQESDGWSAVPNFRSSSTGRQLYQRGLNLKIYNGGAIKDFGTNKGYNDITLVAECLFGGVNREANTKARAWLAQQIHWSDELPATSVQTEPTYPDRRLSLGDAVSLTIAQVKSFFETVLPDAKAARFRYERGIELFDRGVAEFPLWSPRAPVVVLSPETGLGKSTATETPVIAQVRNRRNIVMSFQTIKLAEERANVYRAHGLTVHVYRGYEADDPYAPGHRMCRNIDAYNDAKNTVSNIYSAICEQRGSDSTVKYCPFFKECGKQKQRTLVPDMWFVTSALLMSERPEFISEPDALVIDEALHPYCFGEHESSRAKDWLTAPLDSVPAENHEFIQNCRRALYDAILANGNGPLTSTALHDHGVTSESALRTAEIEGRRLYSHFIHPDMSDGQRADAMHRHGAAQEATRARVAIWREIAQFLSEGDSGLHGDRSRSGRIVVERGTVIVRPFRPVHLSWRVPTLYLDATAPPAALLEIMFGEQTANKPVVDARANITALWSEHVTVRQIVNAPVAMGRVGLAGKPNAKNVAEVVRYLETRAKLAFPAQIGFITYKGLLEQIGDRLPPNVVSAHFGAVAGLNSMERLTGLIVLGRPYVKPASVEDTASILAGHPVEPIGSFYPDKLGGIRLTDGAPHSVDVHYHPDPIAEAHRWLVTEANLLQAIGRLRPHRRTSPAWLEIVSDVALPITVDEVVPWQRFNGADVMVAGGVILTNKRDAAKVLGNLTEDEARGWGSALLRSQSRTAPQPQQSIIRYQKAGPGTSVNKIIRLPAISANGPAEIRAKLEDTLGPLASFEGDRVKTKDSRWAQTALAASFIVGMKGFGGLLKVAREIAETDEATGDVGQEGE